MKNIGQLMKQAQEMQSRMQALQDKLAEVEIEGQSAAGMVTVTLTGKSDVRKLHIDPSLIDPESPEVLEDLIIAAFNDARARVERHMKEQMSELTGGLNLPPGLSLPF